MLLLLLCHFMMCVTNIACLQITPLPTITQLTHLCRLNAQEWMKVGVKNTYEGMVMYSNQRCGYKLCAMWRGLEVITAEDEELKNGEDKLERGIFDTDIVYLSNNEPSYNEQPAYDPSRAPPIVIHGKEAKIIPFDYDCAMVISSSEDIDCYKWHTAQACC